MRYFHLLPILLLALLSACQSGEKKTDCPSEPSAIFSKDLEGVETHDFMKTGTDGIEVISFSNGVFLEIYQSGCDSLRQEFRFRLPEAPADGNWLQEAMTQFSMLGTLGPDYAPFGHWGEAMAGFSETFKPGQPMELEAGFWMQVDQIESFDGSTLIVILANYEM